MPRLRVKQSLQSFGDPSTLNTKHRMENERSGPKTQQSRTHQDSTSVNNELFCAFNINLRKIETINQRFHNRPTEVESK